MKIDIHNYARRLERRIELIKSSDKILEENKQTILKFCDDCLFINKISKVRTEKYAYHLHWVGQIVSKPFDQTTIDDIKELMRKIEENNDWQERTKYDFVVSLKIFYRWLRFRKFEGKYPDEVEWIKASFNKANHRLPEELLTEEDIMKLVNVADNLRDKSFVLSLFESGCRIGELLTLNIKNVQFDQYGAVLLVSGKTGQRRVRIIAAAPSLSQWLDLHPLRRDKEAPLWIVIGSKNNHDALAYNAARALLMRLARKAKIEKKINPHSFRHARATELANKLTEAQMKELFGWTQSSEMASIYVHMSGRNVDNALLQIHGLRKEEIQKEESVIKQIRCERCKEINDNISNFCKRCGSPTSLEIALKNEEKRKKKSDILNKVLEKHPEVQDIILNIIEEMKLEKEFEEI